MAESRPIAALAALAVVLLLPGLLTGPSLDAAVFAHAASEVREGGALYVEVWDHKPPGGVLLLAALSSTLPSVDIWLLAWMLSVLVTVAAGWLVARTLAALEMSRTAAWLAGGAVVAVMAQYLMALGGGLTEPGATALLAASMYAVVRGTGDGSRMAAAILASTAVLISIPAVVGALVVAAIAVAYADRRARAALIVAVGFAGPVGLVGGAWALTGAFDPAIDAVLGYSNAYRASNAAAGAQLSAPVASWTLLALLFVVVPAIIGSIAGLRPGHPHRSLIAACHAWIALSVGLFLYQGRFFAHYAIPLAIPLGILAGFGLQRMAAGIAAERPVASMVRTAPFAVGLLVSLAASAAAGAMEWTAVARQQERVQHVADAVAEVTQSSESIWVWGTAPQLYLAADRRMATTYGYLYPLVTPGYTTPGMIGSTLRDLMSELPEVIVDAGSPSPGAPGFVPLLISRPVASDGRDLDLLDPIRAFIEERYVELDIVDGWVIYHLDDGAADLPR